MYGESEQNLIGHLCDIKNIVVVYSETRMGGEYMIKKNAIQLMISVLTVLILATLPSTVFAADLDEILSRGVIRVGMYNQDPGRMFLDPMTNELKGLEPDIAKDFAKMLGVKLQIVQAEWDALIPGLLADKWDIIIANMSRLPSRAASIDFTLAYENYDGTCFAVRADEKNIKSWDNFKGGIKVGTGRGNAAEAYVIANYPDVTIVPFASPQLAIQALVAGQVDAVAEDYCAMLNFEKKFDKIKLMETEHLVNLKSSGFGVKPGNFRLWLWANLFLIDYKGSGEYAKTWTKWFPEVPAKSTAFDIN